MSSNVPETDAGPGEGPADCESGAPDSEFFTTNLAWEFLRRLSR